VTHVGPEGIQLGAAHLVVGQQQRFELFHVGGRFQQPGRHRLFFDPFDPMDPPQADPVGEEGQALQDRREGRFAAVEGSALRLGKGLLTGFALIPLHPGFGLAEAAEMAPLALGIVGAGGVLAERARGNELRRHLDPPCRGVVPADSFDP
jgi:hypothetical protein